MIDYTNPGNTILEKEWDDVKKVIDNFYVKNKRTIIPDHGYIPGIDEVYPEPVRTLLDRDLPIIHKLMNYL